MIAILEKEANEAAELADATGKKYTRLDSEINVTG